jgi:Transposase, Mutator family
LERFAKRPLTEPYPYVVLDARYERVREDGVIGSRRSGPFSSGSRRWGVPVKF